jgi:protein O-mannosyl-transferase
VDARRKWLICVLLAGMTFALYWPAGHHDFIFFDDPQFIAENPEIRNGLTWHSIAYAFTTPVVSNWHPITTLSHIVDCQLFGVNAGAHHLVSAAIHALNAALLFLALMALTGSTSRSAVVAALFALHPLRVESIAWVAERKDVLSGLFFLLVVWSYSRYAQYSNGRAQKLTPSVQCSLFSGQYSAWSKTSYYGTSLVLFALGLMSKPMLVTTPFVLLLLDIWPLRRMSFGSSNNEAAAPGAFSTRSVATRQLILEKIPFFALSAISCVLTLIFQKGAAVANSGIGLTARLENAIESYARYLGKLFWPAKLSIIYPHPATPYGAAQRWSQGEIWLAAGAIIGVSFVCLRLIRRKAYLAVGWFWFLGMMVPVIGLVQVGEQAMADRYTYLPLIGPVVSVVWLVSDAFSRRRGRTGQVVLGAFSILAIGGCVMATHRQLGYWQNTVTLFQHAVEVIPNNPSAEFSLGVGLEKQGDAEAAMTHYRNCLRMNPADEQAHYNLGRLLRKQGHLNEAAEQYETAIQLNPRDVAALLNLANVRSQLGQQAEAMALFERALQLDRQSVEALNNLAWILATNPDPKLRDGARAVQLAERACNLTGFKQTAIVGTLAAAYAEAGRFTEAVATAEKACALAEKSGETELLKKNQELLGLYKEGKAYVER